MTTTKNALMQRAALAGIVAFCCVAWSISSTATHFASDRVDQGQTTAEQKASEPTRLHDEVKYFSDEFFAAHQHLQHQPSADVVQAF
jgi:hypothetical protein